MIKYINGDLFQADEQVLIHGCNCFHCMGGGVAYYVNKYYPEAFKADCATSLGEKSKLGTYSLCETENVFTKKPLKIVNAYTQYKTSSSQDVFEYDAFKTVLESIKIDFIGESICMPKIGAGLAGGDWNRIEHIINKVFNGDEIVVYYL
jgi:O-acetyl-ADP-ribose deacetylase (regulator of RNase III)